MGEECGRRSVGGEGVGEEWGGGGVGGSVAE